MPNQSAASRTIEERIRAIEDRLEILNLIASHPPAADTGGAHFTQQAYVEDGVMDLGGGKGATGNVAIASGQASSGHMAAVEGGLAHFCGLPRIELHGDTAVAWSYLQILHPHPTAEPHEVPHHGVSKGYRVHRVGANRWDLVRTPDGWKIKRRMLRSLDGTEPARDILRGALKAYLPA